MQKILLSLFFRRNMVRVAYKKQWANRVADYRWDENFWFWRSQKKSRSLWNDSSKMSVFFIFDFFGTYKGVVIFVVSVSENVGVLYFCLEIFGA